MNKSSLNITIKAVFATYIFVLLGGCASHEEARQAAYDYRTNVELKNQISIPIDINITHRRGRKTYQGPDTFLPLLGAGFINVERKAESVPTSTENHQLQQDFIDIIQRHNLEKISITPIDFDAPLDKDKINILINVQEENASYEGLHKVYVQYYALYRDLPRFYKQYRGIGVTAFPFGLACLYCTNADFAYEEVNQEAINDFNEWYIENKNKESK